LSWESITSEAARSTLRERLEDDSEFALSMATSWEDCHNTVDSEEMPEDDICIDWEFDDDLAMDPQSLAVVLGLAQNSSESDTRLGDSSPKVTVVEYDEGAFELRGGVDNELTD